jgi:hypothetical protein
MRRARTPSNASGSGLKLRAVEEVVHKAEVQKAEVQETEIQETEIQEAEVQKTEVQKTGVQEPAEGQDRAHLPRLAPPASRMF